MQQGCPKMSLSRFVTHGLSQIWETVHVTGTFLSHFEVHMLKGFFEKSPLAGLADVCVPAAASWEAPSVALRALLSNFIPPCSLLFFVPHRLSSA